MCPCPRPMRCYISSALDSWMLSCILYCYFTILIITIDVICAYCRYYCGLCWCVCSIKMPTFVPNAVSRQWLSPANSTTLFMKIVTRKSKWRNATCAGTFLSSVLASSDSSANLIAKSNERYRSYFESSINIWIECQTPKIQCVSATNSSLWHI